jgi:DNA-binding NtrC family response regulator
VRELRNKVEMACILCQSGAIGRVDLFPHRPSARTQQGNGSPPVSLPEQGLDWDALEEGLLKEALRRAAGNLSRASRLVGMSRPKFKYRAQKYDLL